MTIRDGKEIIRWTFLSGVLTFAALIATVASTDQAPPNSFNSAEATVNGMRYKLEQVPSNVPHVVNVLVTVENQGGQPQATDMSVALITSVYRGNGGGRVASPGDFDETIHDRRNARESILPGATRSFPAGLRAKPVQDNPRWIARLWVDGKVVANIELKPG